ncbi:MULTISPECIES: nuclear transport factor 2 family protein [Cellvibrio]|uniref:SnoaL-like domain-containing protein n=1 Tax=Cellvibrio fibrivorans TaxID=126350 RepID=A0ABU1UZC1_9GAMM|nr:nuclear transport factor 2 family protein [Cellvibrio fibrivorans]MDR7090534.1 hypothetical protein [Cellvibrio fibrivorans]
MKPILYGVLLMVAFAQSISASEADLSPLAVVNKRMDAYNQHNLNAFLATYAETVQVYTYPDKQLAGGKAHLQSIFEPMFKEGNVAVKIHQQIEKDSYVINHETVIHADKKTDYVSIYKVVDGLITEVRFVRDM